MQMKQLDDISVLILAILVFIMLDFVYLGRLGDHLAEISRAMRRIEARLALYRPLKNEEGPLKEGSRVRDDVEERATQPDIWTYLEIEQQKKISHDKSMSEEERNKEGRRLLSYQRRRERKKRS
jgi:hypothetical protein